MYDTDLPPPACPPAPKSPVRAQFLCRFADPSLGGGPFGSVDYIGAERRFCSVGTESRLDALTKAVETRLKAPDSLKQGASTGASTGLQSSLITMLSWRYRTWLSMSSRF